MRERYLELLSRWPVPGEPVRVPTPEGETFAVVCGSAVARPLVNSSCCCRGSGANAAMWLPDIATYAKHHRVYAVDLIGEPGLSALSRPPLAGEAYVRWLDDVLDGLGVARTAFVGVSLGGRVALDCALLVDIAATRAGEPLTLLGEWGRRRAMTLALVQSHPARRRTPPTSPASLR